MCFEILKDWCGGEWRKRYDELIDVNEGVMAERDKLKVALLKCERGKVPAPVVLEKDKSIKSGVWMQVAISKMPDCKLEHYPLDGKYWTANKSIWKLLVAWDWVDVKKYAADLYDCENYAFLFKGRSDYYFGLNSCGIVIDYSSGHAYNLIVYPNGEVDLFEPQSDLFIPIVGREKNMYGLQEGAILL